jgi:methyltransferase (TIGR00027 family)
VNEALGGPPNNLSYVATDFQHEDLFGVLSRHGYDRAQPTFFIVEGVTMYLPEEAACATFRFVGAHRPQSGIVFDFVYRTMIDMIARVDMASVPEPAKPFVERFLNLTRNEPWVFGLPVGGEREFLREFGLELRETLMVGGEDSLKRYVTKADGTQVGAQAIAEMMARMAGSAGQAAGGQQMSAEQMREQQRLMAYQLAEAVIGPPG